MARLAEEEGKTNIAVIAPAFSADCIETLEEINEEIKESFEVNANLWGITQQDCYAVLGALAHSLALYSCLEALYLGADLLLLSDLRPDRQVAQISEKNASILYATPTQLRQLSTYSAGPLPSLRKVIILSLIHI